MSNINGPEESGSRGNFAFCTINLPKLAIEAKTIEQFYTLLDKYINLSKEYLEYRYKVIANKKVKNFPFVMKQGLYMDSDKLDNEDTIEEALKHSSLSIGFCGLAEALKYLLGSHHGESEEARKLGLEIVSYMRKTTDRFAKETNMNWSTFATPAENLAGRFQRLNQKAYGIIEGVTDRDYMTNSFHVPVYHKIKAIDKIKIEGPYHSLCNAGHISYIEMDGDPLKNITAFESLVKAMVKADMGYFSINHPVDRDPACGYTGIINERCPRCGRKIFNKNTKCIKLPRFK